MTKLEQALPAPIFGQGHGFWNTGPENGSVWTGGATPAFIDMYGLYGLVGQANNWATTTTGAPPAGQGIGYQNNRPCYVMTGAAAAGRRFSFPGRVFDFCMTRNNIPPGYDEAGYFKVSALMQFDSPTGAITGDVGLVIGAGRVPATVRAGTNAGIVFGPRAANSMGLFVRQTDAGAATVDQAINMPGTSVITNFNLYTVIGRTANRDQDAELRFLINGFNVLTLSGGVGTLLPSQLNSANNMMYAVAISNWLPLAANYTMRVAIPSGVQVTWGRTESDLY